VWVVNASQVGGSISWRGNQCSTAANRYHSLLLHLLLLRRLFSLLCLSLWWRAWLLLKHIGLLSLGDGHFRLHGRVQPCV